MRLIRFMFSFFLSCPLFDLCARQEEPAKRDPVTVKFGDFEGKIKVVKPKEDSDIEIAYVNFREDLEVTESAAKELQGRLPLSTEVLVVIGEKANGLGTLIATNRKIPMVVLTSKPIPEGTKDKVDYLSVTGGGKTLYLTPKQDEKIRGKKVVILDDVISTGGTMKAAIQLIGEKADAVIQAVACVFTEGLKREGEFGGHRLISLAHLPVFTPTN